MDEIMMGISKPRPPVPASQPVASSSAPTAPAVPEKPFELYHTLYFGTDPILAQARTFLTVYQKLGPVNPTNRKTYLDELTKQAIFDRFMALKWIDNPGQSLKIARAIIENETRFKEPNCRRSDVGLITYRLDASLTSTEVMRRCVMFHCTGFDREFFIFTYRYVSSFTGTDYHYATLRLDGNILYLEDKHPARILFYFNRIDGYQILNVIALRDISFGTIADHIQALAPYYDLFKVSFRDVFDSLKRMYVVPPAEQVTSEMAIQGMLNVLQITVSSRQLASVEKFFT
jgi:hypothetical protein